MVPIDPRTFDAKEFTEKLAAFVSQFPAFAPHAFANAATRMRAVAAKAPAKRFQLQLIAAKLDQLASQVQLPEVHAESLEELSEFTDSSDYGDPVATEYDGLVHDISESKIHPDTGEEVSELAAALRQQQMADDRENRGAMPVRLTPPSVRPGQTILGQSVLVQYGGSNSSTGSYAVSGSAGSGAVVAVQEGPVCRWDGVDVESMPVSVAVSLLQGGGLGATYPAATIGGTSASYRPFIHALFGAGRGQPSEIYIDAGVGIQFSIVSSFLYVNVGMDAPQATYTPGSMAWSAQMGFLPVPSARAQRTVYVDALANAGGTFRFDIPRFATALLPPQVADTAPDITIAFQDRVPTTRYSLRLLSQGGFVAPTPIGGDVTQILLTNNGTAATTNGAFVFLLGI